MSENAWSSPSTSSPAIGESWYSAWSGFAERLVAASRISCPSFVTDNETDEVSTGQGRVLFEHLTCPKEFRLFTKEEGAEGHCEGMAPILFWDAAFDWLDTLLAK
jgi:hypothetical protein